jgi:hypothetical protein
MTYFFVLAQILFEHKTVILVTLQIESKVLHNFIVQNIAVF